jgi:hypothetical protein
MDSDGGSRNFYQRVERALEVIDADVKDILQRVSTLEGGAPKPPDTMAQVLQRVATLEAQAKESKSDATTTGDRIWEIVKYVLIAGLGAGAAVAAHKA